MKYRHLILYFLVVASGVNAEPDPSAVAADLKTAASTGLHRFLEYRVCSPEHCWSEAYLQWLAPGVPTATVIKTVAVTEVGYGSVVTSASWDLGSADAGLNVRIEPSHGGFDPYDLVIVPGDIGEYEIRRK